MSKKYILQDAQDIFGKTNYVKGYIHDMYEFTENIEEALVMNENEAILHNINSTYGELIMFLIIPTGLK